ncbi:MAG: HD domain-containing protein [Paludibacteraceae bacterium]|nr:HD domain-containing protein [Paludibacteraceae bacterium]
MTANKHKIINDPVFGFVRIPDDLLFDILEHPYVQRLSRIKQLGVSNMVYPGAMHTRLMHSIGAMHLMYEAVKNLREKGVDISYSEQTALMAAILLHDVGHGPFSHVLENTLVDGVCHEDISLLMMERINRDLAQTQALNLTLTGDVDRPLDEAIAIFKDEYPRHFLHQLISSQLDVDRMDYLCRDSFFCGVTEGQIASQRILKMLNVADDRLVIDQKGIYSVEKFIVARRLMYWQVYLHKTSVAAEQMLIHVLRRAKELAGQGQDLFGSPALRYFLYHHVTAQDFTADSEAMKWYALLDDSDIHSALKVWQMHDDKVLSLLSEAYTNRHLFKGKLIEQPLTEQEKQHYRQEYAHRFGISEKDADYFFTEHVIQSNTYSAKDDSIDILYADGTTRNIADASDMWNLADITKKVKRNYFYYYK